MDREEFEFVLSQYLDGTLAETRRAEVEEILRTDPEAWKLLAEYQKLTGAIAAAVPPLPAVRWERLAHHISRQIDERTSRPIFSFKLKTAMALAACLLLAFGVVRLTMRGQAGPAFISVNGPRAEAATGEAMIDISVTGPRDAATAMAYIYDDTVLVKRPVLALDTADRTQLRQIH